MGFIRTLFEIAELFGFTCQRYNRVAHRRSTSKLQICRIPLRTRVFTGNNVHEAKARARGVVELAHMKPTTQYQLYQRSGFQSL